MNYFMSVILFCGCIVNSIWFPRWDAENLCRQFKTKYTVQDNPAVHYRYCRLCSYWSTGKIWPGKRKSQGLLYCSCKLLKHNLLTFHVWLVFFFLAVASKLNRMTQWVLWLNSTTTPPPPPPNLTASGIVKWHIRVFVFKTLIFHLFCLLYRKTLILKMTYYFIGQFYGFYATKCASDSQMYKLIVHLVDT